MTKQKIPREQLSPCWLCGSKGEHPGGKLIDWKDSAWCVNENCENSRWYALPIGMGTAEKWEQNARRAANATSKLSQAASLLARVFGGSCQSCLLRDRHNGCCTLLEVAVPAALRGRRYDCPLTVLQGDAQ